jgi:hypothetical protein
MYYAIDTNLLLNVLILTFLVDRWVRYNETILGSEGKDFKPFCAQNNPKSLKSDLYAPTVLLALELLRFNKVSSCKLLSQLLNYS